MSNFIIIFLCFLLGAMFKHIKRFPASTALSLNLFIIYVSLPALILNKFPPLLDTLKNSSSWWVPISMPWMTFIFSWIIVSQLGKKLKWSKAKTGALILTTGLGNTSFVGFPLLESILGPKAVSVGILTDQPGSFLIVSSLGLVVASIYKDTQTSIFLVAKKIFTFPPFIALITSFIWGSTGSVGSDWIMIPLEKIASTLVPLALFAVGFQTDFNWSVIRRRKTPLMIGLSLKMLLFPLFFNFFYRHLFGLNDFFTEVTILESAMATQITSAVVANEFQLDSELANLMVGLSIPISLVSVPLFHRLLF